MNFNDYFHGIFASLIPTTWSYTPCWGAGSGPAYKDLFILNGIGIGQPYVTVDSHSNHAIFKENLEIAIAWGMTANDNFAADWSKAFPDPSLSCHILDFFFGANLVYRTYYLDVDGGRAMLPLPDRGLKVFQREHDFFEFLNTVNPGAILEFHNKFKAAGFGIKPGTWPS